MPFSNIGSLGATATFNNLFNSHNSLVTRANQLTVGSINAGNGISLGSIDSSGGITLSARLNSGSGISITQGAGITIGLNTAFITGSTGIQVNSSSSGITVSVKLNAGNNITLTPGPSGVTISASGSGGGGSEATFTNTNASSGLISVASGTVFSGKTALQILDMILFPYQPLSFSNFQAGLTGTVFELGETAGNGTYTATWTATNGVNLIQNSGGISYQDFNSSAWSNSVSGITTNSRTWTYGAVGARGTTFSSTNTNLNRIVVQLNAGQTQGSDVTSQQTIRWWSKAYWGRTSGANVTAINHIVGGGEAFIQTYPGTNSSFYAPISAVTPAQHHYILIPAGYTLAGDITDGFFQSPFNLETTTGITNARGLSIPYKIYKSSNEQSGGITYTVPYR